MIKIKEAMNLKEIEKAMSGSLERRKGRKVGIIISKEKPFIPADLLGLSLFISHSPHDHMAAHILLQFNFLDMTQLWPYFMSRTSVLSAQ